MNDTTYRLTWTVDIEDFGGDVICHVATVCLAQPHWGQWMTVGSVRVIVGDLTGVDLPAVFAGAEDDLLTRHGVDRSTVETIHHPGFAAPFLTARVEALRAAGALSPAAADMDPAEVLWQYAESNALDGADRAAVLAFTNHT